MAVQFNDVLPGRGLVLYSLAVRFTLQGYGWLFLLLMTEWLSRYHTKQQCALLVRVRLQTLQPLHTAIHLLPLNRLFSGQKSFFLVSAYTGYLELRPAYFDRFDEQYSLQQSSDFRAILSTLLTVPKTRFSGHQRGILFWTAESGQQSSRF